MIVRYSIFVLSVLLVRAPVCAQWIVENDHDETFTIRIWNDSRPGEVNTKVIGPNAQLPIPLIENRHRIQAVSEGGYVYYFQPRNINNGEATSLSTLITPDRRERGVQVYKYMDQGGFNKSDYANHIHRLSRSTWSTKYTAINGSNVRSELTIQGVRGDYAGNKGHLGDIRYRPTGEQGVFVVDGTWRYEDGSSGQFKFTVHDNRFTGHYTYQNRRYDWSGDRK